MTRNDDLQVMSLFVEIKHELLQLMPAAPWSITAGISFTLVHPTNILLNKIIGMIKLNANTFITCANLYEMIRNSSYV